MSLRRFLLLVARDTTVWIAIACTQALSADEEREDAEEEEALRVDLEERLKDWRVN